MQIHQVEEHTVNVHKLDPVYGMRLHQERALRRGTTARISHPGFDPIDIGPDGTFDVPDEVGAHFVGRPGWYEGPNPFEEAQAPKARKSASA
jgi:hypothetical protein